MVDALRSLSNGPTIGSLAQFTDYNNNANCDDSCSGVVWIVWIDRRNSTLARERGDHAIRISLTGRAHLCRRDIGWSVEWCALVPSFGWAFQFKNFYDFTVVYYSLNSFRFHSVRWPCSTPFRNDRCAATLLYSFGNIPSTLQTTYVCAVSPREQDYPDRPAPLFDGIKRDDDVHCLSFFLFCFYFILLDFFSRAYCRRLWRSFSLELPLLLLCFSFVVHDSHCVCRWYISWTVKSISLQWTNAAHTNTLAEIVETIRVK